MAVLATSTLMTEKKTEEELEWVLYIRYSTTFKDQTKVLLDLESEVNVISQAFTHQLGLSIWKINIEAQKINDTTLETYGIIVSTFSVVDKDSRERFFEKRFLLADIRPNIVLEMPFLTMSNVDIDFQAQDL